MQSPKYIGNWEDINGWYVRLTYDCRRISLKIKIEKFQNIFCQPSIRKDKIQITNN